MPCGARPTSVTSRTLGAGCDLTGARAHSGLPASDDAGLAGIGAVRGRGRCGCWLGCGNARRNEAEVQLRLVVRPRPSLNSMSSSRFLWRTSALHWGQDGLEIFRCACLSRYRHANGRRIAGLLLGRT